jgi:hypothetical protein
MAIELTALRLYAAYFRNSIYVWGRMISVLMLEQGGGPAWVQELAQRAAAGMVEFLPGEAVIFTDCLYTD